VWTVYARAKSVDGVTDAPSVRYTNIRFIDGIPALITHTIHSTLNCTLITINTHFIHISMHSPINETNIEYIKH